MQMGKYSRKAVALAGVLAVTLIAATAVGLWAGAVGPASTDAALVDPAVEMDHDAGVCIGDPVEDLAPATQLQARCPCPLRMPGCIPDGCCCWICNGHTVCWAGTNR